MNLYDLTSNLHDNITPSYKLLNNIFTSDYVWIDDSEASPNIYRSTTRIVHLQNMIYSDLAYSNHMVDSYTSILTFRMHQR